MRFVVVLLVACASKPAPPTPIDKLDRSCKVDADCTLAVDVCCSGCGGHVGEPVNAKAWYATVDARNARCAKQKCPDFNCEKLPDCREEGVAVCKAGTCERVMQKTAACADACTTKADCVLVTREDDCCDHCGGRAMTVTAAAKEKARIDALCATKLVKCPEINCPAHGIDCVGGTCVTSP